MMISSIEVLPALADPIDGALDLAPRRGSPTASCTARPRSLWQWTEMITSSRSPLTSAYTRRISSTKSTGVANPTVSRMLMVVAPASTARRHTSIMKPGSERVASGGELDIVGVPAPADPFDRCRHHLVRGHPQHLLHVDRRGGHEDVDAVLVGAAHRVPGASMSSGWARASEAITGALHLRCDPGDRFEVAVGRCGEPGLDDVYLKPRQLMGDASFSSGVSASPAPAPHRAKWCRR